MIDIMERFEPGEKRKGHNLSLLLRMSSAGTTDINDGFEPGEK
ncbi:MAG: hypothetical protein QM209_02165 [Candidatus Cloacimonadota bacterium]|jgi:hypothetical protein|nr:hypothetical protein [Candidatus Cloacimonas acidaminovorans]MDD5408210.1 hypothetical protein [Candidatus Cloacimonas acidaminovorans]MDI9571963.1 hypothetical protein [Candidatus Cloacimonadota bacterium]HNV61998.1 hypothetical protein [Candidatus Cloacimonas acidaminovorans]HOI01221.1 hypothetical protein [Candidatus Cloacimonas acidaminovorans]